MQFSNMTAEEWVRANPDVAAQIPEQFLDVLLGVEVKEIKQKLKQQKRAFEIIQEQRSFAQDLVETIVHHVGQARSAKQAQQAVADAIEDSYFEM